MDEDSLYCVSESEKRHEILEAVYAKKEKPVSILDISKKTKLPKSLIHFHAKVLNEHGLISLIRPTKKRYLVKITERGIEVLESIKKMSD